MTARRQTELLDDAGVTDEPGTTVGAWKLILTEEDEIDEIAERDAKSVTEKVREYLSVEGRAG
jgi:hypothetical protein